MGGEMVVKGKDRAQATPRQTAAKEQDRRINGRRGAGPGRTTDKAKEMKLNKAELLESLMRDAVMGRTPQARLLFALTDGQISMEEIGTQKRIRSLAMVLTSAPDWDGNLDGLEEQD